MNWLGFILILLNAIIASLAVYFNKEFHEKKVRILRWWPSQCTLLVLLIFATFLVSLALFVQQEGTQEQKDLASSSQGILEPNSGWFFSTFQNKYPYIEIGDSGVVFNWTGSSGIPIFQILNTPLFISNNNGQIKLTANFRGKDGSIAVLEDNEWLVNPSQMTRNYDKDTLEVYDKNHDVVLQVRILKDRIQFQGKFYDENEKGVSITGRKDLGGCVFEQTGSIHSKLNWTIEPIFGLGFGEVRRVPETSPIVTQYDINGSLSLGMNPKGNSVFIANSWPKPIN